MSNLSQDIAEILFFQSGPMSNNMLADWQVKQATTALTQLFEKRLVEIIGDDEVNHQDPTSANGVAWRNIQDYIDSRNALRAEQRTQLKEAA